LLAVRIRGVTTGALIALTGCWRYRAVPSTCPEDAPATTTFDLTVAGTPGTEVHGRVVSTDPTQPIADARVDYLNSGQPSVVTTADGIFTLRADTLGVYRLRVRRVGYAQAIGQVRVRADSGGTLQVVMHRSTVVLDACGYAQVREARPWWQWWFPPRRT
jgi:hypothetical protein